jgi:hypothetical protein
MDIEQSFARERRRESEKSERVRDSNYLDSEDFILEVTFKISRASPESHFNSAGLP